MDREQITSFNSPSIGSSSKRYEYDVFLSFRGTDVRSNFIAHLDRALKNENIRTFIDKEIEKGVNNSTILKAIEDSYISIVIFSSDYASSKWCLNELSTIMRCNKDQKQIVIPVFFDVDPFHVKRLEGSYKKAFATHSGDSRCEQWKNDLTIAGNITGWHYKNRNHPYDRDEADLIDDIVKDVLNQLSLRHPKKCKGLVGIEKSYEDIKLSLNIGLEEVKTLGIWGMGGIGKTTLATTLYEELSSEFEGSCYLANVRAKSEKLEDLREELFSKLLGKNHSYETFRNKRVFIVLDDVATEKQLEELIYRFDYLGPGSRVVVTTRNKQIFRFEDKIYALQSLGPRYSLQLFYLTVFGEKQLKNGYKDISNKVVSKCKGIPLALKAVGASLRNKRKEVWECKLNKLQSIPNMDIHNVLKLSFDGLDRSQKNIFLDIACFFKGESRDNVISIFEAFDDFFPVFGIEVLLDKGLITITNNKIEMHDLIQEMSWEVVHQESIKHPERRSRLWKHEEVVDVLKRNERNDVVEGIILDSHKLNENLHLSPDFLVNITKLRFFKIRRQYTRENFNVCLPPNGIESFSNKLRYLYWDNCCLESLPSNFCAELVELHMRKSKLKNLDGLKVLKNLKVIDLQRSEDLIDIQGLSKAKKLECVNLNFCRKIERLNIHSTYLRQLDVLCCSSLKEISVGLVELRELKLSGNSKLERLKVHSKYISELDLTGVSSLKELDLSNCSSLEEILVSSEEITKLLLSDTRAYASLSWIGNLLSLEELDLSRSNVESLPENINSFQKMRELTLKGNNELVSLPELPPYLRVLQIDDCMNLESLPELPVTLQTLSAFNCISLEIERSRSLVLEHMSQRWIPFLHQHPLNLLVRDYFVLPVKPVTDEHVFDTTESSISIPGLKMSDLSGFIYCIILSQGLLSHSMLVSIYQDDILLCDSRDGWNDEYASCRNQTQDHHAMFWYHDIKIYDGTSVVYDNSKDITFKFKIDENQQSIKRFNVTPVYV